MLKYLTILLLLYNIQSFSQTLPSLHAINYKKASASSDESFVLDFDNDDDCTSNCGSSFYGEVTWSTNMSTYTVSMWVKSGESDPGEWRAFFNTHTSSSDGFQMDSNGGGKYRMLAKAGNENFGSNTIKTTWVHLAVVADGSQTKLYYNGSLVNTENWVENTWSEIEIGRNRNADRPGNYYLDEVRVWNAELSSDNINAWMHKPIDSSHPNYSNLKVYFQMNSNSISGTTLLDMSGNNNNAALYNSGEIQTSSSYVPVSDLVDSYQTDVEALWSSSGTTASQESDGLSMSVSSTLAEANFAIFGNNNTTGTSTSDLPSGESLQKRSSREWQVDEIGTVSASVIIDISDATGNSVSPAAAANYKLLYKSCTECDFTVKATGASSSDDIITFSNVALQDGFYAIASTDSNL